MMTLGKIVALATVICLSALTPNPIRAAETTSAQSTHDSNAESDLKMTRIGHGELHSGHYFGFRIYEAPDGSWGEVSYATLPSVQDAQQQLEEWAKLAEKITNRKYGQKGSTRLISDRILGSRELIPKDPTKTPKATEFLIIRRDGVNCYFIESLSLITAIEVEGLIQ